MGTLFGIIVGIVALGSVALLARVFARRARRGAVDEVHRESQEAAAVALHEHKKTVLEEDVKAQRIEAADERVDAADAAALAAMIDEVF